MKSPEPGRWILKRGLSLAAAPLLLTLITGCPPPIEDVVDSDDVPTFGSTIFEVYAPTPIDQAMNIVFVPDEDYGDLDNLTARQAFVDDIAAMMYEGYWNNNMFASNLGQFNFWYTTATGSVDPPRGSSICPRTDYPREIRTEAGFADLYLLVHQDTLRDCRVGKKATTEPSSFGAVVHESGHALFNLPDEYCCDGGYHHAPPVLYRENRSCERDPVNASWRDCFRFRSTRGPIGFLNRDWFRSEGDPSVNENIMTSGGTSGSEFGRSNWEVIQEVLSDFNSSSSTPTVFAPNSWEWPSP